MASFVAEDRFLPRQLMNRGHRLVFSNGIIALTALSVALLVITGGSVNALVPFYAIGVFTGFSMAWACTGMMNTIHPTGTRWQGRLAINLSAGILSTIVVGIFAVAKFTEGAWLVVVVFPVLVFTLMRLNREYRAEAAILGTSARPARSGEVRAAQGVRLCEFGFYLAVIEALRYGRGLRADELTAVHFMVDEAHAKVIRNRWEYFDLDTPLRVVDCPDRRVTRAAQVLVAKARDEQRNTNVTVLLPRRTMSRCSDACCTTAPRTKSHRRSA